MNIREVRRVFAEKGLIRALDEHPDGRDAALVEQATERIALHDRIRHGFACIFNVAGNSPNQEGDRLVSNPITLMYLGNVPVTAVLEAPSDDRYSIVTVSLREGGTERRSETHGQPKLVEAAREGAGVYLNRQRSMWSSGRDESPISEMVDCDVTLERAEDTVKMIWEAMSNPELNQATAELIGAPGQTWPEH